MECKESIFQNRAGWRLDLTTWLSHEFKSRANWVASLDFCPVVLQLAWLFSCPAYSVRVQLLAACKPWASREIKPRDFASLHSLEHFFTLSHTLPLHDSHLNTRFLSAILQANLSRNKTNTWLIKFNLTLFHDSKKENLKWHGTFGMSSLMTWNSDHEILLVSVYTYFSHSTQYWD